MRGQQNASAKPTAVSPLSIAISEVPGSCGGAIINPGKSSLRTEPGTGMSEQAS